MDVQSERRTPISARTTWRVLLSYIRPYRWALIGGAVLSLATAATGLALPLVVRELVGALGSDRSTRGLLIWMTVLVIANAGIGAVGSYVLERVGESVVLTARRQLTSRLLRLRLSAVEAIEPGDLMSRVTGDTTQVRAVATQTMVSAVTGTLTLIGTLALMAVVDFPLFGLSVSVLIVAALVIGVVVPRINQAARRAQESVGIMGAALERLFGAFRTIKASGAEEREEGLLHEAAGEAWKAGVRAAKWSALAGNVAGLSVQVAFLAVLSFGGARVASGAIDVGTLVAFLLYIFYLMPPIGSLTNAVTQYQVGAAAIARILEAEELPVESSKRRSGSETTHPTSPTGDPMTVSFESVRFRYGPDLPAVHHGVTFNLPAGGMTAFVGPSGAGKTTVFSLIERFYEPESGRVLVNGRDVQEWPLGELRGAIGYVEQDSPVLSGSLRENVVLAAPHASSAEIARVITTARLEALVAGLPDGLETLVGHRGTKLSGGERQRVAIARALLRNPRLLLLDEATSQLDAVNEAALRETIADVARFTTVVVVAHRLSTVTMADRIIVMDAGVVRAVGTHAELQSGDPLYAELAATQFLATADH